MRHVCVVVAAFFGVVVSVGSAAGSSVLSSRVAAAPKINGFRPTAGVPGTTVKVAGSGFTDASSVQFNGVAATSILSITATAVKALVPAGATTGRIRVTTPVGTTMSSSSFKVKPSPQPTLARFTPTSGSPGTVVTLTGTGLLGATSVQFNGAEGTVTSNTASTIKVLVPGGSSSGPITVTTPGGTTAPSAPFTVVASSTAPGALDRGFGPGRVTVGISNDDAVRAVLVQPDGKVVVAGGGGFLHWYFGSSTWWKSGLARFNPDGTLDSSFGTEGIVKPHLGDGDTSLQALALQPDGKLVVAGRAWNGTNIGFAVLRLLADGTLDTSFGGNGVVTTPVGTGERDGGATAVVVGPAGRIIVAGKAWNGSDFDLALARYLPDGTLDPTFGGDGVVTSPVGPGDDVANALVRQPDGRLVVAGETAAAAGGSDVAVVRYDPDGGLDSTFGGGDGIVTTSLSSGDDTGNALVLQPDGKLVVAGGANGGSAFALVRYKPGGNLDATFNGSGAVTTEFGAGEDVANALVLQPDGKLVAAGSSAAPADLSVFGIPQTFALARYTSTGAPDTAFGTGGKLTTRIGIGEDAAYALALQGDGKLVAAGGSLICWCVDNGPDDPRAHFGVARYKANGNIDPTFARYPGRVRTPLVAVNFPGDVANAMAVQQDGKIVLAGEVWPGNCDGGCVEIPYAAAIVRYNPNGTLDETFGADGFVIDGPSVSGGQCELDDSGASAHAVALQPDGKIVVAGFGCGEQGFYPGALMVGRYLPTGDRDHTFGHDGFATVAAARYGDSSLTSVVVMADGKIVAAGTDDHEAILLGFNPDGTLDSTFGGGDGTARPLLPPDDRSWSAAALAVRTNGKLAVVGTAGGQAVVVALNPDGSFDTSFGGGDGTVESTSLAWANALVIQDDGKLAVAGVLESRDALAVARYNAGGTTDATFGGGDGLVTTSFTDDSDVTGARAVLLQKDGKLVAAGSDRGNAYHGGAFVLARYMPNGVPDRSFGIGGVVSTGFGFWDENELHALAAQPDGKIVAAGGSFPWTENLESSRFALARYFP